MTTTNQFACALCPDIEAMEVADFKAHREQVHKQTEHRGRQRLTMHLDGKEFWESHYEWRLPPPDETVFAYQVVYAARSKQDKARWS